MKTMLALVSLLACPAPAFGQDFSVTTTLVGPLTGPDAQVDMQARDICGTDLGTMAEIGGKIVLAFGDTFGWLGDTCPRFGPNMRSNVIGFTTDKNPSDGVIIEDWLSDANGRAIPAIDGNHDPQFTGEFSKIPTAMVAVGDTLYLHYMSVHGFTFSPGVAFLCNHSRFILSRDGGRTWEKAENDFGDYLSHFNMLSLSAQPGTGNEDGKFVYAIGTPCGRAYGARVARVPAQNVLQNEAWEFWDGAAWTKDRAQAVEVIKPTVGEGSLVWNPGIGKWMFAYGNAAAYALELRFADRPEGPWSKPEVLVDVFDYAAPYGTYMTPSWIAQDGLTFHFVMSQFARYNTYVMKAELKRRSE